MPRMDRLQSTHASRPKRRSVTSRAFQSIVRLRLPLLDERTPTTRRALSGNRLEAAAAVATRLPSLGNSVHRRRDAHAHVI